MNKTYTIYFIFTSNNFILFKQKDFSLSNKKLKSLQNEVTVFKWLVL